MNMIPHVIRPGEYLSLLATRFGFDAKKVWNDEKNKELRTQRPNPEVLLPGDVLYVPGSPTEGLALKPMTKNQYVAKVPKIKLRLAFRGDDGKPAAGKQYYLDDATEATGSTDGSGQVELEVPILTTEVRIALEGIDHLYVFRVGHLDPVSSESGVQQRLVHLGYLPDTMVAKERVPSAVKHFQEDHGLTATGKVDQATADQLVKVHGA